MAAWSPPGVRALASYQISWLRRDVVAGIVLTTLLVPQGMAYAELAGLPAITGLYTTILCLIGYAVFGPSRILVLGPDSSLGPMIAATILPIVGSDGSPERAIALASMLALIVGAIMIAAGIAKLGFVADLLSKPTQIGYMNGLALTILVGQLPKLFGFSTDANGLINEARAFVNGLTLGRGGRRGRCGRPAQPGDDPGPRALVAADSRRYWSAVVAAIVATSVFDLADHGVSLVGTLPKGFPPLTVPSPISDLPLLVAGALGIALVALTDTISTASSFAARTGQEVDGNGEMIGIGAANVAAGFFQGFPVSTSGSRTAVAEQAGAKTQLTGVVGAAAIVLMLVFVPGLLQEPPKPDTRRGGDRGIPVARGRARDRAAVAAASRRVPALDHRVPRRRAARSPRGDRGRGRAVDPQRVPPGMVALPDHTGPGSGDARLARPPAAPDAEQLPGLVIFRFDAPLFFANARTFRDQIRRLAAAEPRPRWILIAAEPITDVDTTAADMLAELDEELNAEGTSLVFAELKDPVRAKLERYELIGPLDPGPLLPHPRRRARSLRSAGQRSLDVVGCGPSVRHSHSGGRADHPGDCVGAIVCGACAPPRGAMAWCGTLSIAG